MFGYIVVSSNESSIILWIQNVIGNNIHDKGCMSCRKDVRKLVFKEKNIL